MLLVRSSLDVNGREEHTKITGVDHVQRPTCPGMVGTGRARPSALVAQDT